MKFLIAILVSIAAFSALAGDISPKMLSEIESRISIQKEELNLKTSGLDIVDIVEGKIVASIIISVEDKIEEAEMLLAEIESDESLTEENIQAIVDLLDEAEVLIESI
ncbi:MAG: hypothetical protein HOP07_13685 [Bacteriovoracaceae bacterium]|nr:hypothetical protein [Bacteriovoracaceae bacterium]